MARLTLWRYDCSPVCAGEVQGERWTVLAFLGSIRHVCEIETLRAAYGMARQNDGAPGVDELPSRPSKHKA
jgi:hypothetical protein